MTAEDARFMDLAVAAARRGLGRSAPRPSVGAVIVRDGAVLAEATTRPFPGAHAEPTAIEAARAAGHDVRGATMYVTLEPCCHHGRTPPCTDAIVDAGIARVVVGTIDPYEPMRGRGVDILRERGVDVVVGVGERDAVRVTRGFLRAVVHGLPEVTCKVAASLDGHIATGSGESRWITGEAARAHGHGLRAEHDAILVGIGTVLADDPRLTCRTAPGVDPVPVVLDTELRIPAAAAVFRHPRQAIVVCAEDAPQRALDGRVERVRRGPDGRIDVEEALRVLVRCGLHRVLAEGGAAVHRSLLERRVVDEVCVYLAPILVPGGMPWFGGPPLEALGDALRFGAPVVEPLGDDVLLRYPVPHQLGD